MGLTVIVVSFFESVVGDHSKDHAVAVATSTATPLPVTRTTLCWTQLRVSTEAFAARVLLTSARPRVIATSGSPGRRSLPLHGVPIRWQSAKQRFDQRPPGGRADSCRD
jgi:hypothetical protein